MVVFAYMSVTHVCAWYLPKPEEGIGSPEGGVRDGHESPSGCWELDLGLIS